MAKTETIFAASQQPLTLALLILPQASILEVASTLDPLRAANRPEKEMSALFSEDLKHNGELFSKALHQHAVGAFEGANYEAKGYYRSEMQCIMFDRSGNFCQVCQDGISSIIDLYSKPAGSQ